MGLGRDWRWGDRERRGGFRMVPLDLLEGGMLRDELFRWCLG